MFDDIVLFVKIVQSGNFSKAARIFNLYPSKIHRRMVGLEEELGVQLFKKNVPEMELTDYGRKLYDFFGDKLRTLIYELDEFKNTVKDTVDGVLNVYFPPLFSDLYIHPYLQSFLKEYPELVLNISYLVLNTIDLNSFPFDIAISRIPVSRPLYQQRVIFRTKLILAASQSYLDEYGTPSSIEDLAKHILILLDSDSGAELFMTEEESGTKSPFPLKVNIVHNSSLAAMDYLKYGSGIVFIPEHGFQSLSEQGLVKRVLPDYHFGEIKFYLINSNFESSKKHELFIEFIEKCLLKIP